MIVLPGNTISDIVLNGTGNIVNWDLILYVNGFSTWTPDLFAGQEVVIPDDADFNTENLAELKKYPANNGSAGNIDLQITELFLELSGAISGSAPVIEPEVLDTNTYYSVRPGESISDTVLNATGNYENWNLVLQANEFNTWVPDIVAGQQIKIPADVVMSLNNYRALNQYPANNFSVSDIDRQIDLVFDELLHPVNDWILRTGYWDDLGYWRDSAVWID